MQIRRGIKPHPPPSEQTTCLRAVQIRRGIKQIVCVYGQYVGLRAVQIRRGIKLNSAAEDLYIV